MNKNINYTDLIYFSAIHRGHKGFTLIFIYLKGEWKFELLMHF